MPDSENEPQNPIPEENLSPTSPQDPTEPTAETTDISDTTEATPEPQEAQGNDFEPKVESEHIPENQENEQNQAEIPQTPQTDQNSKNEAENPASEPETAQIPGNEPFKNNQDQPLEESKTKTPEPESEKEKPRVSYLKYQKLGQLLVLARNTIQFRKRKKLDKVMSLFLKHQKITNDEVEKFLHVSDATATRYLSQLEKEGRIKQNGKTGRSVTYSRM
jgi:predicted HTH transcriptional regulator